MTRPRSALALVLFAIAPTLAVADGLSEVERRIVAYVDAHQAEARALLERSVDMNSGTMNFDGVRAVGRVFDGELEALGFSTRWVDGSPFDRAGHLVAERPGDGLHVLLIGHLDTVFELSSPFQRYEAIDAETARGPGVVDMKGGNVVMLQALAALIDVEALDPLHVTVVLTGDEEKPGDPIAVARAALIQAADGADLALAFENADNRPDTAIVARRGFTSWQLEITAKPAHSSQIFRDDIGAGAAYEAARILTTFYERLAGEPFLTFNPGLVLAGTDVQHDPEQTRGTAFGKDNVIAERAIITGDLRTISAEQLRTAKGRMQMAVSESLPHTNAWLVFKDRYPPLAPTDGNLRLLGVLDRLSRDLGAGPVAEVDPRRAGAADVSFTAGHVDMVLDGLGLLGDGDHTVEEIADLRTLPLQTKRAALLLFRLGRDGKP